MSRRELVGVAVGAVAFVGLILGIGFATGWSSGESKRPVCGYDLEQVPVLVGKVLMYVERRTPVYCDEPAG